MRILKSLSLTAFMMAIFALAASRAHAWPRDIWATQMAEAFSPVKHRLHEFNMELQWVMVAITSVVAIALLYIVFRFARKRNPTPSRTTHNVKLEILWTLIPCVILVWIMWHSFPLMYFMEKTAKPDLTLKVVGYQWFWGYSYPDQEIEEFSVYMIPNEQTDTKGEFTALRQEATYQRLLSTYELASAKPGFVVLPVNKKIRVQMTANDVIHAWALPNLGVKKDAVPGRLNETWMEIDTPGIYYGQCSELCGTLHAFMPIEVRAVDVATFNQWASMMKTDSAAAFAMVHEKTQNLAREKIVAPHLTLQNLWEKITTGEIRESNRPKRPDLAARNTIEDGGPNSADQQQDYFGDEEQGKQ